MPAVPGVFFFDSWLPFRGSSGIRAAIGGNLDAIAAALDAPTASGKPKCILAHTVKGKGVSFMENQVGWHGKAPNDEEYEIASDAFDEMLDDEEYDELVSEEELAAEEEDAKKF